MVSILFFPLWEKLDIEKNEAMRLSALSLKLEKTDIETGDIVVIKEQTTIYLGALCLVAAALAMYSIFRYDNRLAQLKLNAVNSLFMGAAIGLSVYLTINADKEFLPGVQGSYATGYYLFVVAMLANIVSNRFIRKDENLVRSADRLR